jgi:tetratricopeptide (TPR) repeat protein
MGAPPAPSRVFIDSGIAGFERMSQPFAPQLRQQASPVLYAAYLATRDPRYLATWRRWTGPTQQEFPELDALAALASGDTAAAQAAARRFPSPDSLRAAGAFMNGTRWIARAEVLAALGDARRALTMYEALEPARFGSQSLLDPAFPLYARSFLARGRLYEELGERARAAAAYERFLTLWKDADPEFQPQLREARAGLTRVRDAGAREAVR